MLVFMFVSEVGRLASLASLGSLGPAFLVDLIFVFIVVFMFVSVVGRLASLASLGSLGARFHCGVHLCHQRCVEVFIFSVLVYSFFIFDEISFK